MTTPVARLTKKLVVSLQTKMKKLLWARSTATPIGFKHDKCEKRISIRYSDFVRLHDTYGEAFLTHTEHPGIIVIAPPGPILNPKTAADRWLAAHLGPNHDIACVIGIEGSGTAAQTAKLEAFRVIAAEKKWKPLEAPTARGGGVGNHNTWTGEYFVFLQGSGVSSAKEGCVPLANDAIEYASKEDQEAIKHQILYMILQVPDRHRLFQTQPTADELEQLKDYCECHALLDWTKFPVSPIAENGTLRCWSERPITAENFLTDQYSQIYAQKCHVDSVASASIDFDPVKRKLKTAVHPYGFLWGIMKFNMLQGKGSIADAREDLGCNEIADLKRRLAQYEAV